MNKFYVAALSCLLVFALVWVVWHAPSNHPGVPQNDITNVRTFDWRLAGIDFRYPGTWTVLSWASSSEMISHLELISSPDGAPKDQPYFCVELSVDPANSDSYQLRGGKVIARAANGLSIYERFLNIGGLEELQAWLTNDELTSVLPLANGKNLFAEVSYRCMGGDAQLPTLTAGLQQSSTYYAESLSILQSVASATPSVGD